MIKVKMLKQWRRFLPGKEYEMSEPLAKALIRDGFAEEQQEPGQSPQVPTTNQKEPGPSQTHPVGPENTGEKRKAPKKKPAPKKK